MMDVFFETGETARLLKLILPKSFRTSNTEVTKCRLKWIISLMEEETGDKIEDLC